MRRHFITKGLPWLLLFVMAVQIFLPVRYVLAIPVTDAPHTAVSVANGVIINGVWLATDGILLGTKVLIATTKATAIATGITAQGTTSLELKEYILDLIARVVAATLIRTMTNQVVGWIQGGSNVGFVANLDQEFRKAADQAGGEFLNKITGLNLCGDIGAYLKISLRVPTGLRSRLQCSLTQIVTNLESFARRFQNGGWKAFFALELQPQNNLTGAYLIALDAKINAETTARKRIEVGTKAGAGFLGFRVPKQVCEFVPNFSGGNEPEKLCHTEYVTKTPGRLVSDTLSKTMNIGYDFAVVADEIDESITVIVTALLQKLISSTFEIIDGSGEVTGGGEGIFDPGLSNISIPIIDLQNNGVFVEIYENLFIADAALRSLDGTLIQKRRALFAARTHGGTDTILEQEIAGLEAKKADILTSKFDLLLLRRSFMSILESPEIPNLARELSDIVQKLEDRIGGLDVTSAVKPKGIARNDLQELFLGEKTNLESSIVLLNDTISESLRLSTSTDITRNRLVAQRGILQLSLSFLGDMFNAVVTARTREELEDILLASSQALIDSNQILDQGNRLLIETDIFLPLPNLFANAISMSGEPRTGNTLTFTSSITNNGGTVAGASTARYCMDVTVASCYNGGSERISVHSVGPIGVSKNSGAITSSGWTAIEGSHTVIFCSDVAGVVTESDESSDDNCEPFSFGVGE